MLYLPSASIGLRGEATLTVASSRPEFARETQQYLLRVGTNQLAVAIDRWHAETERRCFASLVESSSDFVGVASLAGVLDYINPAGLKLVGLGSLEGCRVAPARLRCARDASARPRRVLACCRARRALGRRNSVQAFRSGTTIPFLVDWFCIDDPRTHEPMNIAIVGRDLTDEKRSEAKLRDFNAALEKRVLERTAEVMEAKRKLEIEQAERWRLDARLQELQSELFHAARLSATGQMAGALAHELSQPLAAVANYTGAARRLLENDNLPPLEFVRSRADAATARVARPGRFFNGCATCSTRRHS